MAPLDGVDLNLETMPSRTEKLLQGAGRTWELLTGWACALISVALASLFVCLLYLVAWRNPREYGVNDLHRPITIVILGSLLTVAIGFSVIAFRLISRRRSQQGLMSPLFLRMWGSFFGLMTAVVLVVAIMARRWIQVVHCCELLVGIVPMTCAAFILASRREAALLNENPMRQSESAEKEHL